MAESADAKPVISQDIQSMEVLKDASSTAVYGSRARDMFRMNRYKEHFEVRKKNQPIEVVDGSGIFRKEAVPVTGEWNDSNMYCPYPYADTTCNPGLNN